jgi:hypothetical protein
VILALAVAGAGLVTLGTQLTADWSLVGRAASGLGAAALVLIPFIRRNRLGKDSVAEWTRARSASEALKSEVFLYQSRADPYGNSNRDRELAEGTGQILDDVKDLNQYAAGISPDDTPPPPPLDPDGYIEHRVDKQIDGFYRPKAATGARRLRQFRALESSLVLTAAGIGAVAAFVPSESIATGVGAWVAVVTTAGAAIAAHVEANRYEYLVNAYSAQADQLEFERNSWRGESGDKRISASDFVHRCENVISVQNQKWMAKWAQTPETARSQQE